MIAPAAIVLRCTTLHLAADNSCQLTASLGCRCRRMQTKMQSSAATGACCTSWTLIWLAAPALRQLARRGF